ncbi:hypothetical protein P691DRAFT_776599 [Macrolepiota fuliginosa MF-IS2]|uniref:Fungal-type protein kinase domain-containing protein n=1 Tax=Macrolepiota fuliginosa MF-IS2 TaxID=1400762 RepID=A0A9P5X975_9AGAR|nr:hypothetical protein P691DRAFT_776599 [Macrolepiota fuliginosa MF-IS2]
MNTSELGEASSSQHPSIPPEAPSSGQGTPIVPETPRSVKTNAGESLQVHVRADVMKEMADEMHKCPLQNFLVDYAPFRPSQDSVDAAFQHYTNTGKLVKSNDHPDGVWADFLPPSKKRKKENENQVFARLQSIIDDLRQLECLEEGANKLRHPQFHYMTCPNNWMAGEIGGTNFRVDACITSNPGSKTVILADTAVVAEFKKSSENEGPHQNRQQLVSAANQIMNDDPRRTWIYGITIEDTMMSVWYFCRSHSVMSAAFDFTTDIKSFIRVFMSFLYATPEEIGYDPTIRRQLYNNMFHYIYELKTDEGPKYFRTIEPLFNSRVLCITGRKTRVWRAIEVRGPGDFAAKDGASEIALKDVWIEADAETEAENLDNSFTAIVHAFIALVLLYLIHWVHRDVSAGNIIIVKVGNMVQGKLSDLEYAKKFGTSSAGGDPKTGTPFFMPIEIHRSEQLYRRPVAQTVQPDYSCMDNPFSLVPDSQSPVTPSEPPPDAKKFTPQFRFQHDLESLWWIIIWILLHRTVSLNANKVTGNIFTSTYTPDRDRIDFFCTEDIFKSELHKAIPSGLTGSINNLNAIRVELYNSYTSTEMFHQADDPGVYIGIYMLMWWALGPVVRIARGLSKTCSLHGGSHTGINPKAG